MLEHRAMNEKVKALAWEEGRVAGVITAWCLFLTLGLLGFVGGAFGSGNWSMDRAICGLLLEGAPIATGLLLILNPDNSGNLVGGFSKRLLRLPAPIWVEVGIVLAARTALVFLMALLVQRGAGYAFGARFEPSMVVLITLVYLAAQLADWARGVVSGLTSLLVLAGLAAVISLPVTLGVVQAGLRALRGAPWMQSSWGLLLVPVAAGAAYGIAVPVVRASRAGRRIGVPEIWEWPGVLAAGRRGRVARFSSPMAAQVWLELRRWGWTLPLMTLIVWLVGAGFLWMVVQAKDSGERGAFPAEVRVLMGILAFAGLVLGAAAHGLRSRSVGFRTVRGAAGFGYLLPMSSEQYAMARVIANVMVLLPTLAGVLVLHWLCVGLGFWTQIVPVAWRAGGTSAREIAWVFLSRGVLVGIIAWMLTAAPSRRGASMLGWVLGLMVLILLLAPALRLRCSWEAAVSTAVCLMLIEEAARSYGLAWRRRLISTRTMLFWGGVWGLATYLVYPASLLRWLDAEDLGGAYLVCLPMSLAGGALLVLPYAVFVLDADRRRHGAIAAQEVRPGSVRAGMGGRRRARRRAWLRALAMAVVLGVVWVGWPSRPVGERYWRAQGYPVSMAELEAWYEAIPPEENAVPDYVKVGEGWGRRWRERKLREVGPDPMAVAPKGPPLLVVEGGSFPRTGPLPEEQWEATSQYWEEVTAATAADLKRVAREAKPGGWCEADFPRREPGEADPWRARNLALELQLDALYESVQGNPEEAVEAVLAMFPIADLLGRNPLCMTDMSQQSVLIQAVEALEIVLNRSTVSEGDLARLQEAFEAELPPFRPERVLAAGVIHLRRLIADLLEAHLRAEGVELGLLVLPARLAFPSDAEWMTLVCAHEEAKADDALPSIKAGKPASRKLTDQDGANFAVAPIASSLNYLLGSYESQVIRLRMHMAAARVALAVERYRRAHGGLPESLEALVPEWLEAVPVDELDPEGSPLRYRQWADGTYAVYSVGMDGEDDHADETLSWKEGDEIFAVSPVWVSVESMELPLAEPRQVKQWREPADCLGSVRL